MAAEEPATRKEEPGEWLRVADSSALSEKDRLHLQVKGRYISILRHGQVLHCLDSICYHTGGPLALGDIEDVNGERCIRCPWHDYSVRLVDGAKPYQSMKFDPVTRKLSPDGWKYTQNTQRTHEVMSRAGDSPEGGIWVRLSSGGKFESDQFAYNASAAKNVTSGDKSFAPDGKSPASGYKRSGEVLAEIRSGKASPPPMRAPPSEALCLVPHEWRPVRILSKKRMTKSMWLFRFALPEGQSLGWNEVERHVRLRLPGSSLERAYTPVSPLGRLGSFELAIKVYEEGALSSKVVKMAPGQLLEMCGPYGDWTICWTSRTLTRAETETLSFQRLVFVVAGSGITPCIQVLQDWVAQGHRASSICIDILYANRTEDEIAFRTELEELVKRFTTCSLLLAVSHPVRMADWSGPGRHAGRLDEAVLAAQAWRVEETLVMVCGPDSFNSTMRAHLQHLELQHVCL
ncbi:unnamed protein product [Durusdinium trenchii]|uniref:Cytochrome-b5 reductase n=1 Tax=Durusdinium trenchii TaxID=1381693 RepID=A0ABP0Q9K3_9DINO